MYVYKKLLNVCFKTYVAHVVTLFRRVLVAYSYLLFGYRYLVSFINICASWAAINAAKDRHMRPYVVRLLRARQPVSIRLTDIVVRLLTLPVCGLNFIIGDGRVGVLVIYSIQSTFTCTESRRVILWKRLTFANWTILASPPPNGRSANGGG